MFAVIDRFEGDYAVLIFNDGKTINIYKDKIPMGAKEQDVLEVGENITIDREETEKRKKEARKYFDLWEK